MRRIAVPAVTVMIVVIAFVAASAWNRSGEPRLVTRLTERELRLWFPPASDAEDRILRLRVSYESRYEPLDARNWLPESRLRELGFDVSVPPGDPKASDVYDKVPPRVGWVALEYEGPAWREIQRRRELLAAQNSELRNEFLSRLVPVDAAADFETLQVRYPSGHLIMRAVIGLSYVSASSGGPLVHGTLRYLVPETIAVPSELRDVFAGLSTVSRDTRPRYEVDLAIGRLGLPYVQSARRPVIVD